jgi:hypothetical protein
MLLIITKKMGTLSEYQDMALNSDGGCARNEDYPDSPNSPELFFHESEITDVRGLSEIESDVILHT